MRHVRNAEGFVPFDRAVYDIDRVAAQEEVDEAASRPLPTLDLVLPHEIDELALLDGGELREFAAVQRLARTIDRADRGAIEVRIGRTDVHDPRLQQRLFGRYRELLVDEMGNAGLTGTGKERLAQGLDRFRLVGLEQAERDAAGARVAGREQ